MDSPKYVVDTHPLVWYFLGIPKISETAKGKIAEIVNKKAIGYISCVVLMEATSLAVKKKAFDLNGFLSKIEGNPNFVIVPVCYDDIKELPFYLAKEVVVDKQKKPIELHDALIMILARHLALPLITKDSVIHASNLVQVLW